MKNFESRNKPKVNELGVVKRLSLQFISTINGAAGRYIDQYDVSVYRFSIGKAHALIGAWNSPLPSTLQLLGLAREYAEFDNEDHFLKVVMSCLNALLRTLALTPSTTGAAARIDAIHGQLLDGMRESIKDKVWYQGFRSARLKDFKKVLAELD